MRRGSILLFSCSMEYENRPRIAGQIAPGKCDGVIPPFVRPKEACRLFGVGRSTLAEWIARGLVKSHLIRQPRNISGMRLISTESLRAFIERHDARPTSQKAYRNRMRQGVQMNGRDANFFQRN